MRIKKATYIISSPDYLKCPVPDKPEYAGTQDVLAFIANGVDAIISAIGRLAGAGAWGAGFVMRLLQFGNVQGYAFVFGLGVVGLIYFLVFK